MRAFAKLIGVDQSTLSKFFKRERNFTWATMSRCLERLQAPKELIAIFKEEKYIIDTYSDIEEDHLNLIADWKCWAAIEYLKIDPLATTETIALNFNVALDEMSDAINRMIRLGYLISQEGILKITRPNNAYYNNENTSLARKELQKDLLKLSLKTVEEIDIDFRYHGSLTIAIDKNKLPEIKEKLNAIQFQLAKFIQKSNEFTDVYQMTLSFFPLALTEEED